MSEQFRGELHGQVSQEIPKIHPDIEKGLFGLEHEKAEKLNLGLGAKNFDLEQLRDLSIERPDLNIDQIVVNWATSNPEDQKSIERGLIQLLENN